jgi:hypothetical protein
MAESGDMIAAQASTPLYFHLWEEHAIAGVRAKSRDIRCNVESCVATCM